MISTLLGVEDEEDEDYLLFTAIAKWFKKSESETTTTAEAEAAAAAAAAATSSSPPMPLPMVLLLLLFTLVMRTTLCERRRTF
jgi:hypothetical protein